MFYKPRRKHISPSSSFQSKRSSISVHRATKQKDLTHYLCHCFVVDGVAAPEEAACISFQVALMAAAVAAAVGLSAAFGAHICLMSFAREGNVSEGRVGR